MIPYNFFSQKCPKRVVKHMPSSSSSSSSSSSGSSSSSSSSGNNNNNNNNNTNWQQESYVGHDLSAYQIIVRTR